MLLSYLKLSLRLLIRNPFFTFINVLGLAVGFASFMVLWDYSQHELKSDQFHKDYERIYRLFIFGDFADGPAIAGALNPEIIRRAADDFKEIEEYTRIVKQDNFAFEGSAADWFKLFFSYTNKENQRSSFLETRIAYADPNFFDFFSFPLFLGNSRSVLSESNSVVLSKGIARKYFGAREPLGEVLYMNDTIPLRVTGVFEDLPSNTHLVFDMLISTLTIEKYLRLPDSRAWTHGYYKLQKNIPMAAFDSTLNAYVQKNFTGMLGRIFGPATYEAHLQPLKELAFNPHALDRYVPKSRYLLSVLGLVSISVLLMAWVNYINMTLSANQKRMKELAARKAVGANSFDFIRQFIMEALLLNGVALLVAITLIQLIRTPAQVYFGFYVVSWSDISLTVKLLIGCTTLAGITITGMYPAIATLNVSPKILFGEKRLAKSSFRFSHVLTVFQYGAAMALIIWAFSVYLQITHVLNFDIGVKKDQVVVIDLPSHQDSLIRSQVKHFESQLSSSSFIMDYTFSHDVIGDRGDKYLKRNDRSEAFMMEVYTVDARFIPFYGIKLIAGRNFLPNHRADENTIILSRKAIRALGFRNPEDALGAQILVPQDQVGFSDYAPSTVIGVFEDYFADPFFKIYQGYTSGQSLFPSSIDATLRKASVRIFQGQFKNAMGQLQKEYAAAFPHTIFNSNVLEDQISRAYDEEKIVSNQIILFTLIAIGIACLGLLGMMSHKAVEKTKEIGIRKVLGARMRHLGSVLLGSSLKQLLLAMILGLPIARYLTQQYLEKYTEQITLQWWHFALPVLILVMIMFLTIASVLWKAAKSNPVEALKYE